MLKIRLFCAAGMSTSLLERRMREAAAEQGIEVDIIARPVNEMSDNLDGIDVALLGPQVRFMADQAKMMCTAHGVPMEFIPMRDYGTVNGKNVLDLARQLSGK